MYFFTPFKLDSHKAFIQFPNVNNERLIFAPSINLIPRFCVCDARSLPAKSIKLSFEFLISIEIPE